MTSDLAKTERDGWLRDRVLLASLLLALVLCAYGLHWGVAETWHADQLVYRDLLGGDRLPLEPPDFLKPPFHTYVAFFLVRMPVYLFSEVLGVPDHYRRIVELIGARSLTVALFLGQIVIVYVVSRRFFGRTAARVTSLLLATSAGFVAHSHFLTVDVPASFWMLMAFLYAQNILLHGRKRDYILAGLLTGVAAATKYNGLAVGVSIPVAHWLACEGPFLTTDWAAWRRRLFDPRLVAGVAVVVVGFVAANPYAVISYAEFLRDFLYNVVWAQYHEGAEVEGRLGYGLFFERLAEVFGVPAAVLIAIGTMFALARLFVAGPRREIDGIVMLGAVFALYYAYFGSFGRLPMRFVLPVAPYWLMLAGPLCAALRPRHLALPVAVAVAYNLVCSVYVGWRFTNDPRMLARSWISDHVAPGSSIEYTSYVPRPERFPDKQFRGERMPPISGRVELFKDILAENALVQEELSYFEGDDDAALAWYTADALAARSPDYVWIVSDYYDRFLSEDLERYYPGIRKYFTDLLDERTGYAIAYDAATPALPWWIYPQYIDALGNRITILQRSPSP